MRAPETRSVSQCTYTPVVNEERVGDTIEGFEPKKPYLKMAILHSLVPDLRLIATIVPRIRRPDPKVLSALGELAGGRPLAAARQIADKPVSAILDFARDYTAAEEGLVDEAHDKVVTTLETLAQKSGPPEVSKNIASELAKLHKIAATPATKKSGAASALKMDWTGVVARIDEQLKQTTVQPLKISLATVQEAMTKQAAPAAQFLGKTGFFALDKFFPELVRPLAGHAVLYKELYLHKLQRKRAQIMAFETLMKFEPVGYLHLEKLDFTPVGYELGELVYSLPMLPGETVRLTHREWTRTESEFEKIIQDSLESYTEESLTEKSELTTSTDDQRQHSSAFNAGVRVSGSYGPVTIAAEVGYNAQNSETSSRKYSATNSREVTQKASSRVKKEQKLTFRIASKTEVEDISYREIKNETTQAVRWDFHRLVKKWRVDLYRFDVRLTYDIVVPEPASYLIRKYVKLDRLKRELDQSFSFSLTPSMISRTNYQSLGSRYGVALDPPPAQTVAVVANDFITYSADVLGAGQIEVRLPDGYYFESWSATGDAIYSGSNRAGFVDPQQSLNAARLNAGAKNGNVFVWTYYFDWSEPGDVESGTTMNISIFATGRLLPETFARWQAQCYERLIDGARGAYEIKRQALTRAINQLEAELYRDDALVLRKVEKEEIMKGVLRWVLGPEFSFYPPELPDLGLSETQDLNIYEGGGSIRDQDDYENLLKHGDVIRFLHQAIEWENVVYVLYPYFWTDATRWDLKQGLYHTDYIHRSFLRAGAARVVLTIRPGFEESFLSFMETLELGAALESDHPYITVAEELKAMANTSYPFTPLANEPPQENLVDRWYEFTPTGALDVRKGETLIDNNLEPEDDG